MPYKDPLKRNQCKKNYVIKYPWRHHLTVAKARCNNLKDAGYPRYGGRGIKYDLTFEQGEILWNRDKAWLLKIPSIDRIDNDGDYTFDNCQFIERGANSAKDKFIPILQFNIRNIFIKEWPSLKSTKEFGFNPKNICENLNGRSKTAHGFIWRKK